MTVKIGINGFGRIGRSIFRAISKDPAFADIEVVAINDLTDNATLGHLLQYDSIMGIYEKKVESDESGITVDGRHIAVSSHRNPAKWRDLNSISGEKLAICCNQIPPDGVRWHSTSGPLSNLRKHQNATFVNGEFSA